MKLTKTKLKQIIKEELNKVLKEEDELSGSDGALKFPKFKHASRPYRDKAELLRDLYRLRDFVTEYEDDPNYSDWTEPGGDLAREAPAVAEGILNMLPTKEDDLRTIKQKLNDVHQYTLENINDWKRDTPRTADLFDNLKEDLEGILKRIKATNENF